MDGQTHDMLKGAYSSHFRNVQDHQLQDLHSNHYDERAELSTKAKKLQTDTNRRRKAIAIKRKLEAQKEEKRRQEILAKRREAQREATERFQRAHRPSRNRISSAEEDDTGSIHYHQPVPTLEDALYAARGSTNQRTDDTGTVHQRSQSAKVVREVYGDVEHTEHDRRPYMYKTSTYQGRNIAASRQLPASQTELHNKSLRNLNNSRSLFEQQLEQHQQLLIEHQHQTLADFNQAIRKEIDEDPRLQGVEPYDDSRLSHSASLCSLNSLEEAETTKPNVANEMKEHMDNVSIAQSRNEENNYAGIYQPHPPNNPPPAMVSPRSQALLQHSNSGSAIAVTIPTSYTNGAKSVLPSPSVQSIPVARYSSPLQRSHSSPTIAVVQPNNAQVSDDMEISSNHMTATHSNQLYAEKELNKPGTYQSYLEKGSADQTGYQSYPRKELNEQQSNQHQRNDNSYVTQNGHAHNQNYTVAVATVAQPYTSSAYSISKPNYDFTNKDGAKPYVQTSAWMNKPITDNKLDTYTSKSHVGPSNGSVTTQAAPYTAIPVTNNVTHSTYGITPPSTQNLLNAIETMTNSTPKQQVPNQEPVKVNTKSQQNMSQSERLQHHVRINEEIKSFVEPEDDESETTSSEGDNKDNKGKKEIKGILKKTPGTGRGKNMGVKGLRANISTGASVRDSLEVAREHQHRPRAPIKRCKKSVRFSDLEYDDGTTDMIEELGEDPLEYDPSSSSPREESNTNALSGGQKRKSKLRPFSAKLSTTTPPVDPNVRAPRVASAGNARRGPFVRPHPPPGKPQLAFRANQYSNHGNTNTATKTEAKIGTGKITLNTWTTGTNGNAGSPNQNQNNSGESGPVYDSNGVRLDRTPTDDEINWLWEKVRTCLNRTPSADGAEAMRSNEAKKPVTASQKLIDGNLLAPQFQTSTRISSALPATNGGVSLQATTQAFVKDNTNTYPKRTYKISMDKLNTYTQRSNQSRNHGEGVSRTTTGPQTSHSTPKKSQAGQGSNVSESMAGFLAAEKLADQSLAENEIERAIHEAERQQQAFNAARPAHNEPSTLSIEEQRLKQSLDRLNERLKAISDGAGVGPTGMFVPRPPTYQYGSFRGHHPKSAPRSHGNKQITGSLPPHTSTRGHSATGGRHVYAGHSRH